jgi:hypothetical protein
MTSVLVYVDTRKQVGDPDHLKVFANAETAERWFLENDPAGVAFEYPVIEKTFPEVVQAKAIAS